MPKVTAIISLVFLQNELRTQDNLAEEKRTLRFEMWGLCGILLLWWLWVAPGNSEVYSSAADMMEVFKLERELVGIMDNFAAKLQKKLDKINSYLEVS